MNKEQRIIILDLLRVISIVGVVFVHTTSRTIEQSGYDILRIPFSLILNEISRFAVPLFFIISGFILEHKYTVVDAKTFYKKRLIKIVIPYVIWNVMYYLFYYHNTVLSIFTTNFIKGLFIGDISIQMYFIPALLLLYLLFPFLHTRLTIFKKNIIPLFVIFILGAFYDYYFKLPIIDPIRLLPLNIFVFMVGMLASHYQEEIVEYTRAKRVMIILILLVSATATAYESKYMFLWYRNAYIVGSNWRITIYMYTFALAACIYTFGTKIAQKYSRTIKTLSALSFFVFFVHLFFLSAFWKLFGSYLLSRSMGHVIEQLWFEPVVFLFTVTLSFLSAFIVSKIPVISVLLGIQETNKRS